MRKLVMLVTALVLLTGVLPTASAQCENCPTATPSGNSCPEPIDVAEQPDLQMGHVHGVTDSGIVIYFKGDIALGWNLYAASLMGDVPPHRLCTGCGYWMWVDEAEQALFYTGLDKHMYRVPLSGGGSTQLIHYPDGDELIDGELTPDGRYYIALVNSRANGTMMVYRADATGGNVTVIMDDVPPLDFPISLPSFYVIDDNTIVLGTKETDGSGVVRRLYAQPIDGGEMILLSADLSVDEWFRSIGDHIYFSVTGANSQTSGLYRVAPDGTGLTLLAEGQNPETWVYEITPDGQTLVYFNDQSLYAVSLDSPNNTGPMKFFDYFAFAGIDWAFTPDSQAILVVQAGNIYRVPLTGGEPQLLTSQPLGDSTGIQPDYFGDWMIQAGDSQPDAELAYAFVQDYYLIPADGNGSVVKFASARMVGGGYGELYLMHGDRLIFVNSGEGISGIYSATLDDLVTGGQDPQLLSCTATQGLIRLFGVYNHLLLYVAHSETASQMFAVPLE